MLQPFEPFKKIYLDKIISMKRIYMVSQNYKRGFNHFAEAHKIDLLFTEYEDKGLAEMHYNAVKQDKFASIINLSKNEHLSKVIEMMNGEKYNLYWCVVKSPVELQKRIDSGYKDEVKRYINKQTDWRIKGNEELKVDIEVVFGELYVNLKWNSKRIKTKFEEIEKS